MKAGARIGKAVGNLEEIAAGAGLVGIVVLIAYTVVNRYLLERSAVWAPELAGMVFAWVVFLGASAAWKRRMHVSIGVVVRYLHPRARAVAARLAGVVLLAFLAYATYLAVKITITSHTRISPVMRVPYSYVYASAAVAFGLMFLRQTASLMRPPRRGEPTEGPA
jgi:TRAP-type C4-dicarboxylate transport system permease small subunit